MKTVIRVPARRYEDFDDSLRAAALEYADDHGIDVDDITAEWDDETNRDEIVLTVPCDDDTHPAVITERGNGFPEVGDYVPGDDGEIYEVVELTDRIQTGSRPGEGNWVRARVRLADWSDCEDGAEHSALCSVEVTS